MEILSEEFVTDEFLSYTEFRYLFIARVVHRLRSAHKDGIIPFRRVFLYEFGGDKTGFVPFSFFVAKYVDEFYIVVFLRPSAYFIGKNSVGKGPATIQKHERTFFIPFVYSFRQSPERRYAATAGYTYYRLCVAQGFVCKISERCGSVKLGAHRKIIKHMSGSYSAVNAFYRYHIFPV